MSSKRWRGWARARAKMTQLPQAAAVKENGAEVASDAAFAIHLRHQAKTGAGHELARQ